MKELVELTLFDKKKFLWKRIVSDFKFYSKFVTLFSILSTFYIVSKANVKMFAALVDRNHLCTVKDLPRKTKDEKFEWYAVIVVIDDEFVIAAVLDCEKVWLQPPYPSTLGPPKNRWFQRNLCAKYGLLTIEISPLLHPS